MPKGYVYILECSDGSFYTGSTTNLDKRLEEHQRGHGANYTKKRLPIQLVYVEEFQRIDDAFYRKKQIQGWNREKKIALIKGYFNKLPELSLAFRDKEASNISKTSVSNNTVPSRASGTKTYYSNGKLLLMGEYLVLDGANALALPTKYGQSLGIEPIKTSKLIWKSLDEKGAIWYNAIFEIVDDEISLSNSNDSNVSKRLLKILNAAKSLNPDFLKTNQGYNVTTKLDFPKNWGLGTSSTLINNIAQWANVDAFKLLNLTFGGSGYDIACAQHDSPIIYKLENNIPLITEVDFNPPFKDHLYFVYLNQKQDSREGIALYKNNKQDITSAIETINTISQYIVVCQTLSTFENLIQEHENIVSKTIKQTPIKQRLFNDFNGSIKSLGAWGGDFMLVASKSNPTAYFKEKGYNTILSYTDIIK